MINKELPTTPIKFAAHMMRPFLGMVVLSLFLVMFASLLGVATPYVLKMIVDSAVLLGEGVDFEQVLFWVMLVPVVFTAEFIFWRSAAFVGMNWMTQVENRSYNLLYEYVTLHSHSYFSDRFAGSVSNKVNNAAQGTGSLLQQFLWQYVPGSVSFIATGILLFLAHPMVGYIFVMIVIILIPTNIWLAGLRRPRVVDYAESRSKFSGYVVDLLTNIAATRQYARRNFELTEISERLIDVRGKNLRQWRMSEWILLLNNVVIVTAIALMMYVLALAWQSGLVSAGDFVLVATLIFNLSGTLTFIGNSINYFVKIFGEVEEGLTETLRTHEVVERTGAKDLVIENASIEWRNVTFQFSTRKMFEAFTLSIPAGQRLGLVGHSGAGKSTFVSLLLRQHDLMSGDILIDGRNICDVTQDSLRQMIAVVPQEPLLFHRSIRENILYGKPSATENEVIEAAKKAQAHDFIVNLPEGYETTVGERGVKLSGGQRQRVAIARAILKDAPILVLDEATSALDSASEVAIQKALEELMEGRTVIAIAHRLSTLRKMDRIIVLENGSIIEDGTHLELASAGGIYQNLWQHQAGGFLQD